MMSLRARQLPAAIVPGSHKPEKVRAINEMRAQCWEGQGRDRKWVGPGREGEFLEAFTANGLQVSVMATPISPSSTATKREFSCRWTCSLSLAAAAGCPQESGG